MIDHFYLDKYNEYVTLFEQMILKFEKKQENDRQSLIKRDETIDKKDTPSIILDDTVQRNSGTNGNYMSTKKSLSNEPKASGINKSFSKSNKIDKKGTNRAKDELEYATNWRRVFVNIYQHLKWLNAYS